ncbi:beta-L-arabinofuranosidase domain-containing protein [Paenibacillus sp. AR247]|uniref:beta-L-arabinofuranosidase domain-containing protein n=1 Tax=Paenibacillus sp. AR247 TaxID=1631599 RepID=UPI002157D7C6|nr:beta-L-arabinofuranosidase domain-containing protein [Paenibacillus sp. AR247]
MKFVKTAFEQLPLGAVKPSGWLKDQLMIQAKGLTGHLEEHWADVGPENGWIGGSGESWERGPYYLDGLLPLAYLLEDERLIAKANRWVEWSLASQQDDGHFGPKRIETVNREVDKKHDWWHYMIMLKVMMQHEEATKDERIVPFLTKFFGYVRSTIEENPLQGWAKTRGAEMLLCLVWLYKRRRILCCWKWRRSWPSRRRTGLTFFTTSRSGARWRSGTGRRMWSMWRWGSRRRAFCTN